MVWCAYLGDCRLGVGVQKVVVKSGVVQKEIVKCGLYIGQCSAVQCSPVNNNAVQCSAVKRS